MTQYADEVKARIAKRMHGAYKDPYMYTIGPGWAAIVDGLDKGLADIWPDYEVYQVKEKFGGLRYYTSFPVNNEEARARFNELIRNAERIAAVTCEECGEPGTLQGDSYVRTLCDEHQAAHLAARAARMEG